MEIILIVVLAAFPRNQKYNIIILVTHVSWVLAITHNLSNTKCLAPNHPAFYFGGAPSKGFATLRNVSKLTFLGQDWAHKVCKCLVLFGYLTK